MRGLLGRALRLRNPPPEDVRDDTNGVGAVSEEAREGVTAEERRELAADIERLFKSRPSLEDYGQASTVARRTGLGLPLTVNFISIAVLVSGILVFHFVLSGYNVDGSGGNASGSFTTAEGLVVKEVQKQATAALSERDARIAAIERELAQLRAGAPLSQGADRAQVQGREKQLSDELAALRSNAASRLESLSAAEAQDSFLLRQLRSSYESIQADISGNNLADAERQLSGADALLKAADASSSTHLSGLIPAMQTGNSAIRTALSTMAVVASTSSAAAELAARAQEIARLNAQIESLQKTIADLNAQNDARDARITEQARTIADQSTQLTKLQSELAARKSELDRRTAQLSQLAAAARNGLATLRDNAASLANAQSTDMGQKEVLDLLDTKVKIRELAELATARVRFPELSGELNSFFDRYGSYFALQGRKTALDQVQGAIRALDSKLTGELRGLGLSN